MSKEEAIKRGFEFQYYTPYHTRKDLVFVILVSLVYLIITAYGLFVGYIEICLLVNTIIGLSYCFMLITDYLGSERI